MVGIVAQAGREHWGCPHIANGHSYCRGRGRRESGGAQWGKFTRRRVAAGLKRGKLSISTAFLHLVRPLSSWLLLWKALRGNQRRRLGGHVLLDCQSTTRCTIRQCDWQGLEDAAW